MVVTRLLGDRVVSGIMSVTFRSMARQLPIAERGRGSRSLVTVVRTVPVMSLVLVWWAPGKTMLNLLLLQWVRRLVVCPMVRPVVRVMVTSFLLFRRRLKRLPQGPKKLMLNKTSERGPRLCIRCRYLRLRHLLKW